MTEDNGSEDMLAAELRHRTANTFQLMSALARMRSQRAGEPEARRQLVWMADAIGSLGALERHRHQDGVDFCAYLAEMTPVWGRRAGEGRAQIALEVEFPAWAYYCGLNMFIVTQNGNTFTNYFNRSIGDTQAKVPLRQVLVHNIDEMIATSGGANMSSIGKFHWRLQQSASGATATQPGLIYVRKVWWR